MSDLPAFALCHRCGARLGEPTRTEELGNLYCPHCGASQLSLPEYLRAEPAPSMPAAQTIGAQTTGATPPPPPQVIDWQSALRAGAIVAGGSAVLTLGGILFGLLSLLNFIWVISAGVIALALYQKQRPMGKMDARIGARIGVVVGLLVLSSLAVTLGMAGVVARFGLHRMSGFDAQVTEFSQSMQTQMNARMPPDKETREMQQKMMGILDSPEGHGGFVIGYLGFQGVLILMLSAGGGAFAGMLGMRRQGVKRLL